MAGRPTSDGTATFGDGDHTSLVANDRDQVGFRCENGPSEGTALFWMIQQKEARDDEKHQLFIQQFGVQTRRLDGHDVDIKVLQDKMNGLETEQVASAVKQKRDRKNTKILAKAFTLAFKKKKGKKNDGNDESISNGASNSDSNSGSSFMSQIVGFVKRGGRFSNSPSNQTNASKSLDGKFTVIVLCCLALIHVSF